MVRATKERAHPNIVTVYDAGSTAGHRPWLAMEYCSGGSLAQKVARLGPLPVAEVISVGASLCGALSAAHQAGILHRDVKPHNVLLTSYGEPALADFGIASVGLEDGTATETAAYTVVHAAPEILEGKAGSIAADVYSLGSTLYTLVAGQAPFAAEAGVGLAPLVTRIMQNDLPAIARPGVPPELERLLRKAMAAKPVDRPASAAELGEHLADLARRMAADEPPRGRAGPDPAAVPAGTRSATIPSARDAAKAHVGSAEVPMIGARRLLACLAGGLGALLAIFVLWGPASAAPQPDRAGSDAVAAAQQGSGMAPAEGRYGPRDLAAAQGANAGELTVSWRMPVRPDVVATVVYDGAGIARARAVVTYDDAQGVPRTTLHGLPRARRICLSVAHLVSVDDKVTNVVSEPVCAVPR